MSSPIRARRVFLSELVRIRARAPSPSITTPRRMRFGGDGGGAGASAACTGGGGGLGRRRLGENSGRSSVVDNSFRDCAATGLASTADVGSGCCATAAEPATETNRTQKNPTTRGNLMTSLVAKTHASSKSALRPATAPAGWIADAIRISAIWPAYQIALIRQRRETVDGGNKYWHGRAA